MFVKTSTSNNFNILIITYQLSMSDKKVGAFRKGKKSSGMDIEYKDIPSFILPGLYAGDDTSQPVEPTVGLMVARSTDSKARPKISLYVELATAKHMKKPVKSHNGNNWYLSWKCAGCEEFFLVISTSTLTSISELVGNKKVGKKRQRQEDSWW